MSNPNPLIVNSRPMVDAAWAKREARMAMLCGFIVGVPVGIIAAGLFLIEMVN
jgi:hypothetical protein